MHSPAGAAGRRRGALTSVPLSRGGAVTFSSSVFGWIPIMNVPPRSAKNVSSIPRSDTKDRVAVESLIGR